MIIRRRLLLALAAAASLLLILNLERTGIRIRRGLGKWAIHSSSPLSTDGQHGESPLDPGTDASAISSADNHTRLLIIPTLKDTDISWFDAELPEMEKLVYIADDRKAKNHPPKNKGHEVMIYLSYIIDHYDTLPDISIFLHPHQFAWHNNDLLENDMAQMLRRLNNARVMREGYMNLRCQWDPGCPHWLRPKSDERINVKQEQRIIGKAWSELFPFETVPEVLSGACCSQFAVSRDTIRALPISRYVWFRDWIMRTELSDYMSGRVFEYIWQYIFTGRHEVCPSQHICYCDGYGVCFDGPDAFQTWFKVRWQMNEKGKELDKWIQMSRDFQDSKANGTYDALPQDKRPKEPEAGTDEVLIQEIESLLSEMADRKATALQRGMSPDIRAAASNMN